MSNCVFCKKIRDENLVEYHHHDSRIYCFEPLNPVVSGHMLFIANLHTTSAADNPGLTGLVFRAASEYAQDQLQPFNLITSGGKDATQTVPHFHVHYIPRSKDDGLKLPWSKEAII